MCPIVALTMDVQLALLQPPTKHQAPSTHLPRPQTTPSLATATSITQTPLRWLDNSHLKGLASHCKAKTTFSFHFSIINA